MLATTFLLILILNLDMAKALYKLQESEENVGSHDKIQKAPHFYLY